MASVEVSACEDLPLSSHGASSCMFETAGPSDGTAFQDLSMGSTCLASSNCWRKQIDDPHCTETRHCPLLLQRRDSLDKYASMLAVPPGEEGQGDAVFWKELLGMLPEEVKGKRVEADFDFTYGS